MKQQISNLDSQESLLWLVLLAVPLAVAFYSGVDVTQSARKPIELKVTPSNLEVAAPKPEAVTKPIAIVPKPVTFKEATQPPKPPSQKSRSWGFIDVAELQKNEGSFTCPIEVGSSLYIDRVASFKPGKTSIDLADEVKLKRLGRLFLQCPGKVAIKFVGFADASPIRYSAASSNDELSHKRAASAQSVLSNIPLNIHSSEIETNPGGFDQIPDNIKNHPRRVGLLVRVVIN